MSRPPLYAVVLAGGQGTRFWPASRTARPKQFLPIASGKPLLERTCARLEGLIPWERILVVSADLQADLVRRTLRHLPRENLILEPEGRNTAPGIALASLVLDERDPDSVQAVLPADHVIEPENSLRRSLRLAAEEAASGSYLITLGVRPTHPATGYGYIELSTELARREGTPLYAVERFVEKPDLARAQSFLATGRHLWNSGMFAWSTRTILQAYRALQKDLLEGLERGRSRGTLAAEYAKLTSVPVDTAILERASNLRVFPIEYSWNDVGSWAALPEVVAADASGNFAALAGGARIVAEDSSGCVVFAEGREIIALLGVRDLVIVRAGDATLVCPRERAQDVRRIVERLRTEGEPWL